MWNTELKTPFNLLTCAVGGTNTNKFPKVTINIYLFTLHFFCFLFVLGGGGGEGGGGGDREGGGGAGSSASSYHNPISSDIKGVCSKFKAVMECILK